MIKHIGRFAPSPTGPLHFGSLFAAVVSYLHVKQQGGQWIVRIEDIDPPREQAGAREAILASLKAHGLHSDSTIVYQSGRYPNYAAALEQLTVQGRLYSCDCTRKQLANTPVYPGTCRHKVIHSHAVAQRLHVASEHDSYHDLFQGPQHCNPATDFGDVVLKRKDQLYAYQLAVVVDDIAQGVTEVVRGIDLIDSTWWQRELYRALGAKPPSYGHFPVIHAKNSEQKLSKQNLAQPIDNSLAAENLAEVFQLLGLKVLKQVPEAMLESARQHWKIKTIFGEKVLTV